MDRDGTISRRRRILLLVVYSLATVGWTMVAILAKAAGIRLGGLVFAVLSLIGVAVFGRPLVRDEAK